MDRGVRTETRRKGCSQRLLVAAEDSEGGMECWSPGHLTRSAILDIVDLYGPIREHALYGEPVGGPHASKVFAAEVQPRYMRFLREYRMHPSDVLRTFLQRYLRSQVLSHRYMILTIPVIGRDYVINDGIRARLYAKGRSWKSSPLLGLWVGPPVRSRDAISFSLSYGPEVKDDDLCVQAVRDGRMSALVYRAFRLNPDLMYSSLRSVHPFGPSAAAPNRPISPGEVERVWTRGSVIFGALDLFDLPGDVEGAVTRGLDALWPLFEAISWI